jgi:integrase
LDTICVIPLPSVSKKDLFPIAVKRGSSVVKIYCDPRASGEYYRVVFHLGGKRHRLIFRDLDKAKNEAVAKAAQLARGDVDAVQLTGKDRLTYGRALEAVRPFDVSLDAAAIEYAEARKVLEGHPLIEATRFYMRHHGRGITGKLVAAAVEDFRQAKIAAGRSSSYVKDIVYRLGKFSKAFNVEVRQVSARDVADFLEGLKLEARGFNNFALMLRTFFRFCQARGWLSRDVDLLTVVEKRSDKASEIEIFTPDELRKLLGAAPPRVATCIAIQAFAGVRTAELFRLTWQDVERRRDHIEIGAGKAKTASRRLIPISDNHATWLREAPRQGAGSVWPVTQSEYYEQLAAASKAAQVAWKANALRHSFITYRLAQTKDVAATALEAGNSPTMIFRHYRELATEEEAAEWFSILPANTLGNVVRMTA